MFSECSVPVIQSYFPPHFVKTVVSLKALVKSHIVELWMEVGKAMLPMKCFGLRKVSYLGSVQYRRDHKSVTKLRYNLSTLIWGDITGIKTVESVSVIDR